MEIDLSKCPIGTKLKRRDGKIVELIISLDAETCASYCARTSKLDNERFMPCYYKDGTFHMNMESSQDIIEIMKDEEKLTTEQEIAKAKELLASLEARKEEEDKENGNEFAGQPKPYEKYFYLGRGEFRSVVKEELLYRGEYRGDHPQYKSEAAAEGMAEALNILLELQSCKGVVKKEWGQDAWCIFTDRSKMPYASRYADSLLFGLPTPAFDTKENVEAAIVKVGAENIWKIHEGFGFCNA
jgi:hypothetical protein